MAVLQETQLSIPEISCEHCVHAINGALKDLPGMRMVKTDIPTKTVQMQYDPSLVSLEKVEVVLDDIGYTVAKE